MQTAQLCAVPHDKHIAIRASWATIPICIGAEAGCGYTVCGNADAGVQQLGMLLANTEVVSIFSHRMGNRWEEAMDTFKTMGYSFGAAIVASWAVLLVGGLMFGFNFAEWTETAGRTTGILATVAGIVFAIVGLKVAQKTSPMDSGGGG